jgi:hypothetical protein
MKHECGLCLRDNSVCAIGKSFWELLRGKVEDCSIYEDYHKGLEKEKLPKDVSRNWRNKKKVHISNDN